MSIARDKLSEAAYFLESMKNTVSDRDPFRFNLSAFLSAARSVFWFMRSESRRTPGFKEWIDKREMELGVDKQNGRTPVRDILTRQRDSLIHTKPVRPRAHVAVTINGYLGTPTALIESDKKPEWRWYLPDEAKDIVALCEERLNKLEGLVAECESRYGVSDC